MLRARRVPVAAEPRRRAQGSEPSVRRQLGLDGGLVANGWRPAVVSSDGQPFVFTTQVQDRGGLTNGYYLGRPGAVAGIMDRFRYARPGHEPFRNYEHLLLRAFQDSGTARRVTDQVFFKVRASGDVHWLEPRGAAMLRLPCSTRSDVWDEFSRAKQLARTAPGPVACRRASSPGRTQGEKGIIHT